MRVLSITVGALICCFVGVGEVQGQVPAPNGITPPERSRESRSVNVVVAPERGPAVAEAPSPAAVFEAVGTTPPPEPEPEAAPVKRGIDPRVMAETFSNSVINAGGVWNPTLAGMSTGDAKIDSIIVESGKRHGVDPKLIFAVMHQESRFKKHAVSHKGASGYMQLMPGTARRFGVTDIFDPEQNIDAGAKYLRFLLDLFDNNVELALAGYNAGEYRVIRSGYQVPRIRETQDYVRKITSRYYGRTHRSKYAVTYGPPKLAKQEKEAFVQEARASTDDRGTNSLSNIY